MLFGDDFLFFYSFVVYILQLDGTLKTEENHIADICLFFLKSNKSSKLKNQNRREKVPVGRENP